MVRSYFCCVPQNQGFLTCCNEHECICFLGKAGFSWQQKQSDSLCIPHMWSVRKLLQARDEKQWFEQKGKEICPSVTKIILILLRGTQAAIPKLHEIIIPALFVCPETRSKLLKHWICHRQPSAVPLPLGWVVAPGQGGMQRRQKSKF